MISYLRQRALGMVGLLAAVLMSLAWVAARGIDHRYMGLSDGVYSYTSAHLAVHGPGLLYTHLVTAQPPGVLLVAGAVWRLHPSVEALRVGIAACDVITALLVYWIARRSGFGFGWALMGTGLAISMPITNQVRGLDGEVLLAPLLVLVAALGMAGRLRWAAVAAGVGLVVKLTWMLAVVGLVFAVWRARGVRSAATVAGVILATAYVLWSVLSLRYGWHPTDVFDQIVLSQRGLGLVPRHLGGKSLMLVTLWWPWLLLAVIGLRRLVWPVPQLVIFGMAFIVFTLKPGTILNVLAPVEPLIALTAVAGVRALVDAARHGTVEPDVGRALPTRHARVRVRAIAAALAIALISFAALRDVAIVSQPLHRALPPGVDAVVLSAATEVQVDAAVRMIRASSPARQQVVADPLVALLANRSVIGNQPDWFLLHALSGYCHGAHDLDTRHCATWNKVRVGAVRAAIVQLDFNASIFAPTFARLVRETHPHVLATVHRRPLIYAIRSRR